MRILYFTGFVLLFSTLNLQAQVEFIDHELSQTNTIRDVIPTDIDGDGDIDLVTNDYGDLVWYENLDGEGDFSSFNLVAIDTDTYSQIKLTDIDYDNDIDIIVSDKTNRKLYWFENLDGQGDFSDEIIIDLDSENNHGHQYLEIGDIDGDGFNDVITNGRVGGVHHMGWFKNINGTGAFDTRQPITVTRGVGKIFASDFDKDGDIDIFSYGDETGINDDIYWYQNDGNGNFGNEIIIREGTDYLEVTGIEMNDVDNDGDMDFPIYMGDGDDGWFNIRIMRNNGDGTFTFLWVLNTNEYEDNFHVVDLDKDGYKDIVFEFYSDNLVWARGISNQLEFGDPINISSNVDIRSLTSGDIDGDGDSDLIYCDQDSAPNKIGWLEVLNNHIIGDVQLDSNNNGCDDSDIFTPNIMVVSDNGEDTFSTFTNNNGNYSFSTNVGIFTTSLSFNLPEYYITEPVTHVSEFVDSNNTDIADFCIKPTQEVNDVSVVLYPSSDARPGFDADYQLIFRNFGTTILSGGITLNFDDQKISFESASETISNQTSNSISFDYSTLFPLETRAINLTFNVFAPPIVQIDDVLVFTSEITPIIDDNTEDDNTYVLNQKVVGSFDPNDILVLEGEEIYLEEADDYLHYMIRFQNTGTASAINVHVTNIIDDDLDWSTLEIESISHPNRIEIGNGHLIDFIFDNIHLPDSTTDEEGSHGFISYKIKPKNPAALGDVFANNANIYFDFNLPIFTNTVTTTIVEDLSVSENVLDDLKMFPNPTNGALNIQSQSAIVSVEVINQMGQVVVSSTNSEGINSMNIQKLQQGLYFMKLKDINGNSVIKKMIKQ